MPQSSRERRLPPFSIVALVAPLAVNPNSSIPINAPLKGKEFVFFGDHKQLPPVLLDEGTGYGYSSLTVIDDDTLGILYESSRADMTFQKIPIADLLGPERTGK